MMKKTPDKQLVVKDNQLMEARYKLSTGEQKLILYAISKIKPHDTGEATYSFQIKEFAEALGLSEGTESIYSHLRSWTKNILRKPLSIFTDANTELQMNWFSLVKYRINEGTVTFRFTTELIPYLFNLKEQFTLYQIQNILHLRSSYSIRLYELLKQYQNIGYREFSLIDLREMVGVEKEKFKLYNDFKRKVIEPAQRELLASSDMKFEFEEIKKSRAVNAIYFKIKANIKPEDVIESTGDPIEDIATLISLLPEMYRNQKTIRAMVEQKAHKNGFAYVRRNILYANQHSNQEGKYRSYLGQALKNDWGLVDFENRKQLSILEEEAKKKREEENQKKLEDQKQEKLKEIFYDELKQKARDAFEQLGKTVQAMIIKSCKESLNSFSLKSYMDRGEKFEGPCLESIFNHFLIEELLPSAQKDFDLWATGLSRDNL